MSTDSHCLIVMVACTMIIVIYMIKYSGYCDLHDQIQWLLWSTWSNTMVCDLHDPNTILWSTWSNTMVIVIYTMLLWSTWSNTMVIVIYTMLLWSTRSNTMIIVIYTIKYNGYCDLHNQIQWLLWSTRSNTMVVVIYTIQIQWFNCDVCDQRKKQRITVLLVLCELL